MAKFKVKSKKSSRAVKPFDVKSSARNKVGDGKTPNKYFVSVSNDYYITDPKENTLNWASESKSFKAEGKTIKEFDNYQDAKAFAQSFKLGDKSDGLEVNSVFIEDRLTGEVYHHTFDFDSEDIGFTIKTEKDKGVPSTTSFNLGKKLDSNERFNLMMAWEGGEISDKDTVRLFQNLVDTGMAWSLQGMYGRQAQAMIDAGLIKRKK